jgi:tetratricopeptide (TPR) repeat protein
VTDHFFISYSTVDGGDFALQLADTLAAGPPPIPVWVDKRRLRPGEDWDLQIVEAIRGCKGFLFIMSKDSVVDTSVCKDEWVRALKYKKPIIPLLLHEEAELPFRLGSRQFIDFTGAFEAAIARLRNHFFWMGSPAGQLQALKYRLADALRALPRAEAEQQSRIQRDIDELNREIANQQTIIDDPQAAAERMQGSIDAGLSRERRPAKPVGGVSQGKFINPPPLIAPTWFRDRHVETQLIGEFLKDDALRLMTVVGRGGIGKSAMVCRLLRSLEGGQLPDDGGPLSVDGIVYLSDTRSFHRVSVPDLYGSLTKLLPGETVKNLDLIYKNPQASIAATFEALTEAFRRGRTVVLLDNFEDALDADTGQIKDSELREALNLLLRLPPHGLKVIITTRLAPGDLALVEPALQRRLNLDHGLEELDAIVMLRDIDADGKVGLKNAPDTLLKEAWTRTRGYPRALEHLFGILAADRDTSLQDILNDTKKFLPETVVDVLVGEAFSRLDVTAQRVMQALAVYRYPVATGAVDYLLQPYLPGNASGRVLSRLVNMQFARRDAGRYYLHQIDRDYALSRMAEGVPADRAVEVPPFTQFALRYRAAEWFKLSRKPREEWKSLDDLAAQLSEFDLRYEAQDYDTAAAVFLEFDFDYLLLWGHYGLLIDQHERLQGKITDTSIAASSVGNLGSAYYQMGQHQRARDCYEEALRLERENNNRWGEGTWLGNLGACMYNVGQNAHATELFEQALEISREVRDRQGEARALGNLGVLYSSVGQFTRALNQYDKALDINREIDDTASLANDLMNRGESSEFLGQSIDAMNSYKESLAIARGIRARFTEASTQANIGELQLAFANWDEAAEAFEQSIEIADEIGATKYQNVARRGAALVNIYKGDLLGARTMIEAASKYHLPLEDTKTSAVLGIVACRQGDLGLAKRAFAAGIDQAGELLTTNPRHYDAFDAKAIALCGFALCGDRGSTSAAGAAFRAARAITSAPGVVRRVLQLFDALAQGDPEQVLTEIRPLAASAY